MEVTWRLTLGEVDAEPSIILLNQRYGEWEIKALSSSISERTGEWRGSQTTSTTCELLLHRHECMGHVIVIDVVSGDLSRCIYG